MTRETLERCNTRLYSLFKKWTLESIIEVKEAIIGVCRIHEMAVGVSSLQGLTTDMVLIVTPE